MMEVKGHYRKFSADKNTIQAEAWKMSRNYSGQVGKENISVKKSWIERK